MNFQPSFRVHLADPLGLVDTPFIVTTAYTSATGLPRAEWFLVIPEGKGMLFSQRNRLNLDTFPEGRVTFDEELMLNEALDQATLRLRRYILDNKGDSAPLLLAKPTEVLSQRPLLPRQTLDARFMLRLPQRNTRQKRVCAADRHPDLDTRPADADNGRSLRSTLLNLR